MYAARLSAPSRLPAGRNRGTSPPNFVLAAAPVHCGEGGHFFQFSAGMEWGGLFALTSQVWGGAGLPVRGCGTAPA